MSFPLLSPAPLWLSHVSAAILLPAFHRPCRAPNVRQLAVTAFSTA